MDMFTNLLAKNIIPMLLGQLFQLHKLKQELQNLIFKHGPPILQNMEKGGKLNNLTSILSNHNIVKLLKNWQRLVNIE